jgi:protein SCO1/2
MNSRFATAIVFGFAAALSLAQGVGQIADDTDVTPAGRSNLIQRNFNRDILSKMGVDQRLGETVPGDVPFQDEHGRSIKFGDLYGSRPIIVMPMFFQCKGVCGVETDALLRSAIDLPDINVGRDFDIVMLSINPRETPALTLPRWNTTIKDYNRPGAENGFHFLTGSLENIKKVTNALGFKWVYDAKEESINHPVGIIVLSPQGKITSYMINKEFPRAFLTHVIADAKISKVGPKTETVLFGCIMIDHVTGKRSLVIENVIRLCAAIFAVGVAFWIVGMSLSGKSRKAKGGLA